MWWPHPDSLNELVITETENGFELSAPDDSECGKWLAHYSQTEELHQELEKNFINCLLEYARKLDGENEIPNERESDHPNQEENSAGEVEAH